MIKATTERVTFKENYVFITLFSHLFLGFLVSFMPEENVVIWLIINCSIAILAAVLNFIIWTFQKHDSKRYFSLHSFVMLMVIVYYFMSPIFKTLFPTIYFWLLLVATIGPLTFLLFKRDVVLRELLFPKQTWFKDFLLLAFFFVCIIAVLLRAYILAFETGSFMVVASTSYFIALFIMLIAPGLLSTEERVEQLKQNKR